MGLEHLKKYIWQSLRILISMALPVFCASCGTPPAPEWDSDFAGNTLKDFLDGEESLKVREGAWQSGEASGKWTLQDIVSGLEKEYLQYGDKKELTRIEYAYLDCGGDGVLELAVRFTGLDIYSPGDDSNITMIVSCINGEPELVYSFENWARSCTQINYYGVLEGSGSEGAGSHTYHLACLDGEGNLHTVAEENILTGWWVGNVSRQAYEKAFDEIEDDVVMEVAVALIGGSRYYAVNYRDENYYQECENFMELCRQEGLLFTEYDELEALIRRREEEVGIKEEWRTENQGLSWQDLP